MRLDKRLSLEKSNNKLKDLILSNKPFLISRIGLGGESVVSALTLVNNEIPSNIKHWLHNNAGFYGTTNYMGFAQMYKEGFENSEACCYWNFNGFEQIEDFLIPEDKTLLDVSVLESFRIDNPWTNLLEGKKILVVHPFSESMEKQLVNRKSLWENKDVLPEADYLFYKPVQSIGGIGPHRDWYESYEVMCDEISKIDFDIAWLGCGSYGIPLSNFIRKNLDKSAIYIGGGLQLYFGIKGKRWDPSPDVNKFYNEYWIRPSESETPNTSNSVEGGCYW